MGPGPISLNENLFLISTSLSVGFSFHLICFLCCFFYVSFHDEIVEAKVLKLKRLASQNIVRGKERLIFCSHSTSWVITFFSDGKHEPRILNG